MNIQDKIKAVIFPVLAAKGWRAVYNTGSGVYSKNGCVLVLYGNHRKKEAASDSFDRMGCLADAFTVYTLPGISWHLEQHGWLLAKGQISSDVGMVFDFPDDPVYRKALDDLADKLDSIASASYEQNLRLRTRPAKLYRRGKKKSIVESAKTSGISEYVMPLTKVNGIQGALFEGCAYQLLDVLEDSVILTEVSIDGASAQGPLIAVSRPLFMKACQIGAFKNMEIFEENVDEEYVEWVSAFDKDAEALPNELDAFGLTGLQRANLCSAYSRNLYYSILLPDVFSAEESAEVLVLLQEGRDLYALLGKHFNMAQLAVIKKFVRNDYCLDLIAGRDWQGSDMELWAEDFFTGMSAEEQALRAEGLTAGCIKGFQQVRSFSYDCDYVKEGADAASMHLMYLKHDGVFPVLCGCMLDRGVAAGQGVCAHWEDVPKEAKAELRRMFSGGSGIVVCGTEWDDYLDRLLGSAHYLLFHVKRGFLVKYNNLSLGRDSNSFVFYNAAFEPVWRAVYVNGEFVINRAHEEELAL